MNRPFKGFQAVILAAIFFLILTSLPFPAQAQTLTLKNLVMDNQAGSLMVRFGVEVEGLQEVAVNLENGVKVAFVCTAKLYEGAGWWFDSLLSKTRYESFLSFDPLTNEYKLKLPGEKNELRDKDLPALVKRCWSAIDLDMGPWSVLERGEKYSLRMETKLEQRDVPKWLKKTLFFWSWDVVPSAVYNLDFDY